jgi:hypothetical protein
VSWSERSLLVLDAGNLSSSGRSLQVSDHRRYVVHVLARRARVGRSLLVHRVGRRVRGPGRNGGPLRRLEAHVRHDVRLRV